MSVTQNRPIHTTIMTLRMKWVGSDHHPPPCHGTAARVREAKPVTVPRDHLQQAGYDQ